MITITLKKQEDECPVEGQLLSLEFNVPGSGWTKSRATDASGVAAFPVAPGSGTLFVNGYRLLSGWIGEVLVVFIPTGKLSTEADHPLTQTEERPQTSSIQVWDHWG